MTRSLLHFRSGAEIKSITQGCVAMVGRMGRCWVNFLPETGWSALLAPLGLGIFLVSMVDSAAGQDIRQPGQTTQTIGQQNAQPRGQYTRPTQPVQPARPGAVQTGQRPQGVQTRPVQTQGAQQPFGTRPAQPGAQQRPVGPQQQPVMGRAIQPTWVPLPAAHQQRVDQILAHWEKRSARVETYQCNFQRWKYDPVFLPPDPQTGKEMAQEYSTGVIKYATPDKAMYKDTTTQVYDVGTRKYKTLEEGAGHHWICDGTTFIEMVAVNKQMVKTILPPQMRGEAMRTQGPLPFLFGAKAAEIKQRYWVRMLNPPQGVKDRYYLEAYPKRQADAANYQKVWIILDTDMYLPVNLVVYNVNYTPRNPARTSYEFTDRKDNPLDIRQLIPWKRDFFQPPIPKGWKEVTQHLGQGNGRVANAQPEENRK